MLRGGVEDVVIPRRPNLTEAGAEKQPVAGLKNLNASRMMDEIQVSEGRRGNGIGVQSEKLVLRADRW